MHDDEPDDEDWYDDTSEDLDDDVEDSDAVPCPECGAAMYADADHCHECGHWLSEADQRAIRPGTVWPTNGARIVATALLLVFLITLLVVGFALF